MDDQTPVPLAPATPALSQIRAELKHLVDEPASYSQCGWGNKAFRLAASLLSIADMLEQRAVSAEDQLKSTAFLDQWGWMRKCAELRTENERLVQQWQPIETAPKDGTEILLWIPADEESPRKGRWEELLDGRRPHRWCVAYGWCEDKPTHWMPLPTPPALRSIAQMEEGKA